MRLTRKWPEGAAVAALRDIDAVSHKKHRSACRRINQCFLKLLSASVLFPVIMASFSQFSISSQFPQVSYFFPTAHCLMGIIIIDCCDTGFTGFTIQSAIRNKTFHKIILPIIFIISKQPHKNLRLLEKIRIFAVIIFVKAAEYAASIIFMQRKRGFIMSVSFEHMGFHLPFDKCF